METVVSKISLPKIFDYFETGACITLIKMKTSFQMITLADTEDQRWWTRMEPRKPTGKLWRVLVLMVVQ